MALVIGLAGCVSDDQTDASENFQSNSRPTQAPDSSAPTSDKSSTIEDETSTSGPAPTQTEDSEVVDSSVSSRDNSSESTQRSQGKPITVTTIGSDSIGKKSVKSNVTVSESWCETSESDSLLALAEIANSGGLEGDFIVEFEVLNALGVRVGEGVDVVHDVKPGQSFVAREIVSDAVGWQGDARSWTCQVLRISTPDAVLSD